MICMTPKLETSDPNITKKIAFKGTFLCVTFFNCGLVGLHACDKNSKTFELGCKVHTNSSYFVKSGLKLYS